MSGFIVFEGLDGCGKTSQMKRLMRRLVAGGTACFETREPSDGVIGALTRSVVRGDLEVDPVTLAMLFAADRVEHVSKEILPKLAQRKTVLCDRFYYSSIAYQGMELGHENLIRLNENTMRRIRPDAVVFLDASPEECLRRRSIDRVDVELFDDLNTQKRVRESFYRTFELLGAQENILMIPADVSEDEVAEAIWAKLGCGE